MRIGIRRSLEKRLFGANAVYCVSYRGFLDYFGLHFIPTNPSHLPILTPIPIHTSSRAWVHVVLRQVCLKPLVFAVRSSAVR